MADDDKMTVDERRTYLKRMQTRSVAADRAGRRTLLNEMEQVTGMHRKCLVRLLHAPSLERQPRGRTYGLEVEHVVLQVWANLDDICAEWLTPGLPQTAQHLERHGVLTLREEAAMEAAFRTVLPRLLFALVALHPGNGREFLHAHLKRVLPELVPGVLLSRSRP